MATLTYRELVEKGMAEAFPSAPTRPGAIAIRFKRGDQFALHTFAAPYAAKRFLELVIQSDTYTWTDDTTIHTDSNIQISSPDLETIIEHTYSKLEQQFVMMSPHTGYAAAIRNERIERTQPEPEPRPERASRSTKAPSRHRARKPAPEGLTTVAQLADDIGITSREARQRLRKANIAKPANGWAWPADQLDNIKKVLSS